MFTKALKVTKTVKCEKVVEGVNIMLFRKALNFVYTSGDFWSYLHRYKKKQEALSHCHFSALEDGIYKFSVQLFVSKKPSWTLVFYVDPKKAHSVLDSIYHYELNVIPHNVISCVFIWIRSIFC